MQRARDPFAPKPPPIPVARGRGAQRLAFLSVMLMAAGAAAPTLALFLSDWGGAEFGVPPIAAFAAFVVGGFLGIVSSLAGFVAALRGGTVRGMRAFFVGALPAAVLVWQIALARQYPPINDVSTDLADPPGFTHAGEIAANRGRDLSYPQGFKEIVAAHYRDLGPLALADPPAKAFDRALLVALAQPGWELTHVDREKNTFEGVATSRLFRFRDDFVVRIRAGESGSIVDMRSKSRDGRGDLGANAKRIRDYFAALEKFGKLTRGS